MSIVLLVAAIGVFLLVSGVRSHARATGSKAAYRLILGPVLIALGAILFPFVLASRLLVVTGLALTGVAALGIALSKRRG
ncbi:MAG TPA: hypothetical protein VIG51_07760 [Candidatus Baltobacteraceae bacterium]